MTAEPPQAPSEPTPEQLLAALERPVPPVKISPLYRLGLLLVAATMVLLPIVYLAFIAGLGWLVYLHAVNSVAILDGGGGGRVILLKLTLYVAPLIAGIVAVLFMFKPILARPQSPPRPVRITADDHPLFYRFVERLAHAVGAPMPSDIQVDCQVNASASFRRGLASFFGSDLVLTVGLPLGAGLSVRQLAGVLAHELGHFAQGGGMRVTYLIRSINNWFARVVYERDRWDEGLERLARDSEHWAASLVLGVTRGTVWLSRRVLWVLMSAGHVISCFMLRQMEYDADRYEARISGSAAFETTARRLVELSVGSQSAIQQLERAWTDGHLGDDLPALVARRTAMIPAEAVARLHGSSMAEKTSLFATHPADRDRIASAVRENTVGIFPFDQPATLLFADFDGLSRRATLHYYQSDIGLEVRADQLVSDADLQADEAQLEESREAISELFGGGLGMYRPLRVSLDGATETTEEPPPVAGPEVDEELARAAEEAVSALDKIDDRLCDASAAQALLEAGFSIEGPSFHLPSSDLAGVERARARAEEERSPALETLVRFEEMVSHRLTCALGPLSRSPRAATEPEIQWRQECRVLLSALECVTSVREQIFELRCDFSQLSALFRSVASQEAPDPVVGRIFEVGREAHECLTWLRERLSAADHPFARSEGRQSIAEVLIEKLPPADEPGAIAGLAEHVLDTLPFLYYRTVGRIVFIALQMEKRALPKSAGLSRATG